MNDHETNIAIAEACGWVAMPDGPDYLPPGSLKTQTVPSYTTDLNAMHEAEKVLTDDCLYREFLVAVCKRSFAGQYFTSVDCIRATARQRAEAFLRTLGKWKD